MVSLPLTTFPSEFFSSFRSRPACQPLLFSVLLPSSSMAVLPVPETLTGAASPFGSVMVTSERVTFRSLSVLLMMSTVLPVTSLLPVTFTSSSLSFTVSFWVTLAVPSPLATMVMLPFLMS